MTNASPVVLLLDRAVDRPVDRLDVLAVAPGVPVGADGKRREQARPDAVPHAVEHRDVQAVVVERVVEGVTRHFVRRLQQPRDHRARSVQGQRRQQVPLHRRRQRHAPAAPPDVDQVGVPPGPGHQQPGQVAQVGAVRQRRLVGRRHRDREHADPDRVLVDRDPDPEPVRPLGHDRSRGHERAAGQAGRHVLLGDDPGAGQAGHRLQHHLLEVDQVEGDVAAERSRDLVEEVGDVLRTGVTQVGHHRLDVEHARTVSRRRASISRTAKVTTGPSAADPYSAGVRGIKADPFPDDDCFVTLAAGQLDTVDGAHAAAGVATPHARRPGSAPERSPELAHMNLARLRSYRRTLLDEELRASYWRRLIQARRDLLRAERRARRPAGPDRGAHREARRRRPSGHAHPAPGRRDADPAAPARAVGQQRRPRRRRGRAPSCSPGSPRPRASSRPTGRPCTGASTGPPPSWSPATTTTRCSASSR